jgi:protein disulfide-isomerase A1
VVETYKIKGYPTIRLYKD